MFPIRGRGLECPGTHLLSARIEFRFVFGKLKHSRIDWKEERERIRKKEIKKRREREREKKRERKRMRERERER
jgi:hypothetical protein